MLHPLPAETVFEARRRAAQRTTLLFVILAAIYVFFFNLTAAAFFLYIKLEIARERHHVSLDFLRQEPSTYLFLFIIVTLLGIATALGHYLIVRMRSLETLLKGLYVWDPDPRDQKHNQFMNLIGEAEAATGIRPIRPVVLMSPGLNAFSISDYKGKTAIGVTEGLLAKLSRPELSAVIAHEAAHLAHGDSSLITTACSMFSIFDSLTDFFEPTRFGSRRDGNAVMWIVAQCGRFCTRLLYMAISRTREHFADCDAVRMSKDPVSLISALRKISVSYRGSLDIPQTYSAVFIMNPAFSSRDEEITFSADLFSTHPPVAQRISQLADWANTQADMIPAAPIARTAVSGEPAGTPSNYDCPICRVRLAQTSYEGAPSLRCGQCKGWLLSPDVFRRVLIREDAAFSSEDYENAKKWRLLQDVNMAKLMLLPHLECPICRSPMRKFLHDSKVVLDRCSGDSCCSLWFDPQELEMTQKITELSSRARTRLGV